MNRRLHFAVVGSSTLLVGVLLFGTVAVRSAPPETPYTQLGVFSEVFKQIKREYVEEPDMRAVTLGAVTGMLEALDPFASYLNADQYKQYQAEHGKGKASVGLLLARGPGYLRVVDAIGGSPADQAGLTTGDVIESINKISTRDMPLAFAELLLQGEPGSTVEMSVLTPRKADPETVTLTRAPVSAPPVEARLVTDRGGEPIGLVKTTSLETGRVAAIAQRIEELQRQGARRFILDLRYCALGPEQEGVALADLFMSGGLITYTQGQKSRRQDFEASPARDVTNLPLVVLVNRGTAGAAEIAAAALLESKRAQLVGEPTFGNAAVRQPVSLKDGGAIIIATAKYYSPSGKAIQDERVTPEVLEAQDVAVLTEDGGPVIRPERDSILERGFRLMTPGPNSSGKQ
jgi:carboxyl-terminal processing protease